MCLWERLSASLCSKVSKNHPKLPNLCHSGIHGLKIQNYLDQCNEMPTHRCSTCLFLLCRTLATGRETQAASLGLSRKILCLAKFNLRSANTVASFNLTDFIGAGERPWGPKYHHDLLPLGCPGPAARLAASSRCAPLIGKMPIDRHTGERKRLPFLPFFLTLAVRGL